MEIQFRILVPTQNKMSDNLFTKPQSGDIFVDYDKNLILLSFNPVRQCSYGDVIIVARDANPGIDENKFRLCGAGTARLGAPARNLFPLPYPFNLKRFRLKAGMTVKPCHARIALSGRLPVEGSAPTTLTVEVPAGGLKWTTVEHRVLSVAHREDVNKKIVSEYLNHKGHKENSKRTKILKKMKY